MLVVIVIFIDPAAKGADNNRDQMWEEDYGL